MYWYLSAAFFVIASIGALVNWWVCYGWEIPPGYPMRAVVVALVICSLLWPISASFAIGYACWSALDGDCCG